jgi:hypothetical protein
LRWVSMCQNRSAGVERKDRMIDIVAVGFEFGEWLSGKGPRL